MNLRECINQLNKKKRNGEEVSALLKTYKQQSMSLHDGYARIKMMMEYFMFYEVITEDINPYIADAGDMIDELNGLIHTVFSDADDQETKKQTMEPLLTMRQEIMERMQVLTGYVDCFVVYEYILNRVQYRFEEKETLPEDTAFAQEVMNFIFGAKDNVAINDNLRVVLGQLPMRMTRSHYFDLLRNCISVYKGSDVESLEGFLYMFRTSAMLYKHPAQAKYFLEFEQVLEELAEVDFDHMDKAQYDLYAEKVRVSASKLQDLADLYMQIGQIVNETYTIAITCAYKNEDAVMKDADRVIGAINALFREDESYALWSEQQLEEEQDRLTWIGDQLPKVEGKQEKLYDSVNVAEAALDEILEGRADEVGSAGLTEDYEHLRQISLLNSTSVFAELEKTDSKGEVTAEMAEEESEKLIAEIKELFQGRSRMFRRAIMAGTIEKLPTFLQSAQEVADYMMTSLNNCDDEAEKYASKQLILELIR